MTVSETTAATRVDIGIWTEYPAGARWSNEGMTRLIGFLIEGAAIRGRVHFHILVPTETRQAAWDDLHTLHAVEGLDWTLHAPPPAVQASEPSPVPEPEPVEAPAVVEAMPARTNLAGWLRSLPPARLGTAFGTVALLYALIAPLRDLARLPWRLIWRFCIRPLSDRLHLALQLRRDPLGSLALLAVGMEGLRTRGARQAATDLRAWSANVERIRNPPLHNDAVERLVVWTNENIRVSAWISLFLHYGQAVRLRGPKAVIFPDVIPLAFPELASEPSWAPGGVYKLWRSDVENVLAGVDTVITFSGHTKRDQAMALFGVEADRTIGIPHAPPDLSALLPFVYGRRRDPDSCHQAAELLRAEVVRRGWDYLRDFPFDQTLYAVVSTQDRVTKNIVTAAAAISRLLREERVDLKLITTAHLLPNATWTRLPGLIEREQLQFDVVSTPDLPRQVHAALYHCAAITIHPSLFEGGQGPFPFYESVSVGTPCLMARGPHTEELLESAPELADFVFDPLDVEGLMALILHALRNREDVQARQAAVYQRLQRRTWADVAEAYAEAALGRRLGDVRTLAAGAQESSA